MTKDKTEESKSAAAESVDLVTVKSGMAKNADGGDPCALWEKDDRHPGGEIYVSGETPVKAALTPEVVKRIRDGKLIELK